MAKLIGFNMDPVQMLLKSSPQKDPNLTTTKGDFLCLRSEGDEHWLCFQTQESHDVCGHIQHMTTQLMCTFLLFPPSPKG